VLSELAPVGLLQLHHLRILVNGSFIISTLSARNVERYLTERCTFFLAVEKKAEGDAKIKAKFVL
jgi:hypothetical protein